MRNPRNSESATGVSAAIRILLVDDYAPWRHFVVSKLNKMSGLEIVGEVADGIEAIEKALELKPDLILLDIGLPNLSGIEVARRVAEILPRTKIIFLTQNSDKELMSQCLSNGGTGYLVKGDAGGELLPAIEAVMQGTQYISKRMKRD